MLNRDVPNIVYILNKKMLKGIVMEELANDELKKQEIRVRAQAHEYMYEILHSNGSMTLDNSIGSAFFNTRQDIT